MARAADTHEERTAQLLAHRFVTSPESLAEFIPSPLGTAKIAPEDERRMFWQRNPGETEAQIWDEIIAAAQEQGVDPEQAVQMTMSNPRALNQIAHRLYPVRLAIVRAGARSLSPKAQIRFVQDMIRKGPPEDALPAGIAAREEQPEAMPMDQPDAMEMSAEPVTDTPEPNDLTPNAAMNPGGMPDGAYV